MAPSIVLDGTMAYGSRSITINGTAYILNNFTIDRPTIEASDETAVGAPGRRRETAGRATLTGELQLATSTTPFPQFGDTWTMTCDSNYGVETWQASPPSYTESNQPSDIRVVPLKATKVYYGITTVA